MGIGEIMIITDDGDTRMKVNICGVQHTIIECEDVFNANATHFGQIEYTTAEIRINKGLTQEIKKETICHEMVHGILVHLGYDEQSQDEQFVQALGNAIAQGFEIKEVDGGRQHKTVDI